MWNIFENVLENSTHEKYIIEITLPKAGKKNVTCKINHQKGFTGIINVVQGKVLDAYFTDNNGVTLEKADWGASGVNANLFIKVFAPSLKLENAKDSVFPKAGNLVIITTPTFTNVIIGEENDSKKHTLVYYDDVSWFYVHTTGITKEIKFISAMHKFKFNKQIAGDEKAHAFEGDYYLLVDNKNARIDKLDSKPIIINNKLLTFHQDMEDANEFSTLKFYDFNALHNLKLSYAKMTELTQLDKVSKYMKSVKSLPKIPEDIYVAVFAPAYVGDPRDDVMYAKGTTNYVSNASLDKDNNGIQIKELLNEFETSLAGGVAYSNYKCKNSASNNKNSDDCPEDKCIHYADVVDSPKINNQSNNVNKNRFFRTQRINNDHPNGYFHTGVDILTPLNTSLKSLLCGKVVEAYDTRGDLGKIVTVKSKDKEDNDIWIRYCHLNSIIVRKDDIIKHEEKIGLSGNTGNARTINVEYYHVHIEASTNGVFYGGNSRVDPELYMKTKFDETTEGNPIK